MLSQLSSRVLSIFFKICISVKYIIVYSGVVVKLKWGGGGGGVGELLMLKKCT